MPPPVDLAIALLRWLEYAGLLGFIGVVVVRRLAAMRPSITWALPSMQPALVAALIGGFGVVGAEAMRTGHPTIAGLARVAAEAVALGLCLYVGRWVVPPAILAAVSLPFAGHAAAVQPAAGAIFIDAIHVLSAGAWAGGIVALATLHPPRGWREGDAPALVERFGRVAAVAFAATALTGVLRATEELVGVSDLWMTSYGIVLALKVAGVLVMGVMSVTVWRRNRRYARAEASLALAVAGMTALLAAFPMPPAAA